MEELINAYKELDIEDKRVELAEEFVEFLGLIQKLRIDVDITNPVNSSSLSKLYDKNIPENEYLDGVYESILKLKEDLAEYLNKIADILYEE